MATNFQRFKVISLVLIGCFLAYLLLSAPPPSGSNQANPTPVKSLIDLHCHIAGLGAGGSGNFISESMRKSWKFPIYLRAFGLTEEILKTRGDAYAVEHLSKALEKSKWVKAAVVLALDGVIDENGQLDRHQTVVYTDNDFLASQTKKYDNLYFGASINPHRQDALNLLQKVKNQGAVLIKWIPSIQAIDPGDEKLIPFYRKMVQLNLPLLVHSGNERSFLNSADHLNDPARLNLPLDQGVQVISAHVATTGSHEGINNVERLARLMSKYTNLYAEISTLTQINKIFYWDRVFEDKRFQGRLFYASDYPLIQTALVSPYFYIHKLGWRQSRQIAGIENPWDRDLALKRALGLPEAVLERSVRPNPFDTKPTL